MPSKKRPHRRWTVDDDNLLKKLVMRNHSTPDIAKRLCRTVHAVYKRASRIGVSMKPRNQ